MPFRFRAVRQDGTTERGIVRASNVDDAKAVIRRDGSYPLEVTVAPPELGGIRMSAEDLAMGLRAMATLLEARITLPRTLTVVEDLVPAAWAAALPDIRERVQQGEPFSDALEASSIPLPPHALGIVRAGESGSGLPSAVRSAAEVLEARARSRAALANALAYPALLLVAGSASVALLVGLVIPRFAGLLTDYGQALPITTRIVLDASHIVRLGALPTLAATIVFAGTVRTWLARPDGRRRWHEFLLRIPLLGSVRASSAAANACSTLAALLGSGVPLSIALPHAARASGDRAVEARLLAAHDRIRGGDRIANALLLERALPAAAVRMVGIGEETGALGAMLEHAAHVESEHALQRLKRGMRTVEPALIVLFGAVVMLVAAALLQAMYGLRPAS